MRDALEKRPLLLFGGGLVVGLTAVLHPLNLLALPIFLAWTPALRAAWILAFGFILGLVLAPAPLTSILDRTYVEGEGTVVGLPRAGSFGTSFNVAMADRVWRASVRNEVPLRLGERLALKGVGAPLREGSEPYLELHGVTGRLSVLSLRVISSGTLLWRASAAWRQSFRSFVHHWLPDEAASLTEAMCFDMTAGLGSQTTDNLRAAGTLHLVAASGLHVFLLSWAFVTLLSLMPIPRGSQIGLLAVVLLLYCGATGLAPAVVRASMMVLVGLAAYLFRREPDALSALGLAGVVYLLWQPREVYDPGFQISFVTVGAIALFFHRDVTEKNPFVRGTKNSLRLSWIAFLASSPLLAYHFGVVSPAALPANLLVGVGASVGIVSAFLAHLMSLVVPAVGVGILTVVTGPMAGWVLWASEHLSGHAWSSVSLPGFSPYWLPLVYGLLLMTWRPRIVRP